MVRAWTGSFVLALLIALPITVMLGLVIERYGIRYLYERDHLHQVLFTYGLILILNELQRLLFGNDVHGIQYRISAGSLPIGEVQTYPSTACSSRWPASRWPAPSISSTSAPASAW